MKCLYLALVLSTCKNTDDCLSIGSASNNLTICNSIEGIISSLYIGGNEVLSSVDTNSDCIPEEIWCGFYDEFGRETKVLYDGNADGKWDAVCVPGRRCKKIE